MPVALGNFNGSTDIHFFDAESGEGTASILSFNGIEGKTESIEVKKIDTLCGLIPTPNFIKIDVEGFQNQVLKGGEKFFGYNSPLIMIELKDSKERMLESEELITGYGYEIFEITKGARLTKCKDLLKSKKRNFLICRVNSLFFHRLSSLIF